MKFSKLASTWEKLEKTASRNAMTEILAALFSQVSPEEARLVTYLSQGRLGPPFDSPEFNLADKLMERVLGQAFGVPEERVGAEHKKSGDLGDVAYEFAKSVGQTKKGGKERGVTEIYKELREIAKEEGTGSVERKTGRMAALLETADPLSAKYLVRIPLGRLRMGFSDLTVLDALSWMAAGDKSKRAGIEAAYSVRADVGLIAETVKKEGLKGLKKISAALGIPVMPALCQRLPNTEKIIEKMVDESSPVAAVEPKYDGTRLQIHFSREKAEPVKKDQLGFYFEKKRFVRIFTRNLENVSLMFPEISEAVFAETSAREAILDGEAIAFDPQSGKFLAFQETIRRKRKHGVKEAAEDFPLKFFVFDLLFLDGKSRLAEPFEKRRKLLEKIIKKNSKTLVVSPQILSDKAADMRAYHQAQIDSGLEGVVVKKWQAAYDPGRRGYTWVKLKSESEKKGAGLADTIDAVVMGYNRGKGKRTDFGVGAFLVGVVNRGSFHLRGGGVPAEGEGRHLGGERDDTEMLFLTISKIGTGLTDEQWRELRERSEKWRAKSKPEEYEVDKNLTPDVWLRPGIVVEIQADNITRSPTHSAGLALRFPRLVRFRDDKSPKQATRLEEVKELYQMQKK